MEEIIWATPLYKFVRRCNASPLPRIVLDCGAGGRRPPLQLFYRHGYQTYGIEIDDESVAQAKQFCEEHAMPLNIFRGDMRYIPFASETFSFVYTYNAICFMTKPDIAIALGEIERVLKPGGLFYVNFMSVDDPDTSPFSERSIFKRVLGSERFARHEDDEADPFFENYVILHKEKRLLDFLDEDGGGRFKQAYIDYIAQKR